MNIWIINKCMKQCMNVWSTKITLCHAKEKMWHQSVIVMFHTFRHSSSQRLKIKFLEIISLQIQRKHFLKHHGKHAKHSLLLEPCGDLSSVWFMRGLLWHTLYVFIKVSSYWAPCDCSKFWISSTRHIRSSSSLSEPTCARWTRPWIRSSPSHGP